MPRRFGFLLTVSALILLTAGRALAEELAVDFPPGVQIPDAAVPGPGFEVENATQAYLALLSAEQRARSDAYFEGKYWLGLWELVYSLAILFVLLTLRWSARLRDWAQRMTARRWVQTNIDRHFYRRHYNAEQVLTAFSLRVRNETELERLAEVLVSVVTESMQPVAVSLWLRPPK